MAKKRQSEKPGMMLYFEDIEPLMKLPDKECGKFLRAIFNYCKYGEHPDLKGSLSIAWGFIQPKLDRDDIRYSEKVVTSQYANFCRQCKDKGVGKMTFDQWDAASEEERLQWLMSAH